MQLHLSLSRMIPLRGPLSSRLAFSFRTIIIMMLVPVLVSIALMTGFSQLYYSFLSRAEKINVLNAVVVNDLPNELFSIVAGRKRFSEGSQNMMLHGVNQTLDSLIAEDASTKLELTVARRTSETLGKYINLLGIQMTNGSTVDEDMLLLEDIRNVSALLGDMFRDAVSSEIRAANRAGEQLRLILGFTIAFEIALVIVALLFIRSAQRTLSQAVAEPLSELQAFAGKIADGQLSERTPEPDVDELRALSSSLNTMAGKLGSLMEENKKEQENLKKSEMRVLQAQVTPHFLYNTLDAIVWLAEAKRTEEVISITRALSDFYRISLSDGHDWITLAQEEEHLRGYLTIQKIRYRDILDYDIHIDPKLRSEVILKLSIQPLVENAIYHGIKNRRGGGIIRIDIWKDEGCLNVKVSDNGVGMGAERLGELQGVLAGTGSSAVTGYGLFSVNQRIKLYYGQAQGLKVESVLGQGSAISFRVPPGENGKSHV
jgi:two-component system sensor histidine kinase YesM